MGIDSAATNLSWSFISSQKCVFKIDNNYFVYILSRNWTQSEIKDNNFALYELKSVEEQIADILTGDK